LVSNKQLVTRPAFAFLVALFAELLTGCWQGVSRHVQATVLSARGPVSWAANETSPFQPLDLRAKLDANSSVKTADRAQVDLALLPGALVQLLSNTQLRIEELKLAKNGDETEDGVQERVARVQLQRGAIRVVFEGSGRFVIAAAHITITVPPSSLFQLDTDEHKNRLTCARGKVFVSSEGGETTTVAAGSVQDWPSGQQSASIQDRRDQRMTELVKTERELHELEAAQRYRLPF
jgi:FecR protein